MAKNRLSARASSSLSSFKRPFFLKVIELSSHFIENQLKNNFCWWRWWFEINGCATCILSLKGYPDSVAEDYMNYQKWDTLQAFASTIAGCLSTHSVLKGLGVGDQESTALSATVTWILKVSKIHLIDVLMIIFIIGWCRTLGKNFICLLEGVRSIKVAITQVAINTHTFIILGAIWILTRRSGDWERTF